MYGNILLLLLSTKTLKWGTFPQHGLGVRVQTQKFSWRTLHSTLTLVECVCVSDTTCCYRFNYSERILCSSQLDSQSNIPQIWGFISKTVRRLLTKSAHAPKSQKWCTPKNVHIYEIVRTHTCKQSSLYKSQITYKCARINQPLIPPRTRPFLTMNSQCKAPHECDPHIKRSNVWTTKYLY